MKCICRINDRVMSVNGVSLENVDYGTAVSVLRDSGAAVNLVVKRRIVLGAYPEPTTYKVTLTKSKKKDGKKINGPFDWWCFYPLRSLHKEI